MWYLFFEKYVIDFIQTVFMIIGAIYLMISGNFSDFLQSGQANK